MNRKWIKILLVSSLVVAIMLLLRWTSSKQSELTYTAIKVEIPEGTPQYIDAQGIEKLVYEHQPNILGVKVDSLDLNELEKYLESVTAIQDVDVYRATEGENMQFKTILTIRVLQREPLLRVIGSKSNYYMDAEGVVIKAGDYAAKVLLVTGNTTESFVRDELLPMVSYIDNNEFWKAQIKHVQVVGKEDLEIIPLLGDQMIKFGAPDRYKKKLRNLKALYEQGFSKLGWDKYKIIDLRYKGQVVCVKN